MLRHACLYKPTEAVLRPNRTKNKSIDLWQCTRVNLKKLFHYTHVYQRLNEMKLQDTNKIAEKFCQIKVITSSTSQSVKPTSTTKSRSRGYRRGR